METRDEMDHDMKAGLARMSDLRAENTRLRLENDRMKADLELARRERHMQITNLQEKLVRMRVLYSSLLLRLAVEDEESGDHEYELVN